MKRFVPFFLLAFVGAAMLLSAAMAESPAPKPPVEPQLVARATDPAAPGPAAGLDKKFKNPHVEPGKVQWHASFEDACKASARSGKPVLLLQMMGKLDQKFC